jgi:TPP-dependent pyruvate/acetoin dehydrogenase alpha subunit
VRFRGWLEQSGLAFEGEVARLEQAADAEVAAAVEFAEAGSWESVDDLERFVTLEEVPA